MVEYYYNSCYTIICYKIILFGGNYKLEFRYAKHVDLIYHILAYMKVDNASNCYNQQYIENMLIEKKTFEYNIEIVIKNLQNYYNANFNRLMMLNFLPFNCNTYEEMKHLFLNFPGFTDEDKQLFLLPLIEVLEKRLCFISLIGTLYIIHIKQKD